MVDQDKPTVHFSHSQLASEAKGVEPYVYLTKANKRITFPDPYEFDADEGEDKMRAWQAGTKRMGEILEEWLPKKDLEALAADKLNLRSRAVLINKAITYYEKQAAGSLGEGEDSES